MRAALLNGNETEDRTLLHLRKYSYFSYKPCIMLNSIDFICKNKTYQKYMMAGRAVPGEYMSDYIHHNEQDIHNMCF